MHGLGMYGLGDTDAQRTARRLNAEQEVNDVTVGPGFFSDSLDAALEVRGISSADASRVPAAVRAALEASGADVERVCWGGGSGCGGEATRGKVYVKWKPDREYNAVTYADIARNLFMNAADGFAAGSRLIMHRYRIMYGLVRWGSDSRDKYVYPVGGAIPAGAPEAARRTTADAVPLEEPPADLVINQFEAEMSTVPVAAWVGLGVGGTVLAAGIGFYTYYRVKRRPRRNRRRRRRRRTSR
jgi:hypothetical protein